MQPTIMIVEDYEMVRALLREWLGSALPGCRFLEAQSGEEAITLVSTCPPEVVLMDIGLTRMSGIEATRNIKAIAPQTQVVMLTIHEDDAYRADATAAGASAYVPKRMMQKELLPALRALLPAHAQDEPEEVVPQIMKVDNDGRVQRDMA
jgi:two-component system response regulator NreC